MFECPICDFPETDDLRTILDHINDPSAIVPLACDFAERVVDLTRDPTDSRAWLQAARDWEADRAAAQQAAAISRAAWVRSEKAEQVSMAEVAATWAAWCAISTAVVTDETAASMAMRAAEWARDASDNHDGEAAWQRKHVRTVACTCTWMMSTPSGARNRNSLLAS